MKAVILAGGKGTRLAPYTTVLPKPLMPIGEMPIIEVVIRQLVAHGLADITLAVGHLAELIMAYCGDGSRFGASICYSREPEPLGTAGPLALIPGLDEPFLVMNGDLLTILDYSAMIASHRRSGADATMAIHPKTVRIDLGVINTDEQGRLREYLEKPEYHYQISCGIYVFSPIVRSFLHPGTPLDLPDLLRTMVADGKTVMTFPIAGEWLDIGRPEDYAYASSIFTDNRALFLPEIPS